MEKLAKYFSGKLPNSEKINISEFINILDKNLNFFNTPALVKVKAKYIVKYGAIKKDYSDFFNDIIKYKKVDDILEYFELSKSFIETIDYNNIPMLKEDRANYNIPGISIYLVGRFPPYCKPSIDIYDFITNSKVYLSNDVLEEIKQYSKNDEEFIKSALLQIIKKVSKENFEKLLKSIDNSIPTEVMYTKGNVKEYIDVFKLAKCFSGEILSCPRISMGEITDTIENEYDISIDFDKIHKQSGISLLSFYINLFNEIKSKGNNDIIYSLIKKYNINSDLLNGTGYKKYLNNTKQNIDLLRVSHYLAGEYNDFSGLSFLEFKSKIEDLFDSPKDSIYYETLRKQSSGRMEIFIYSCLKDLEKDGEGKINEFIERVSIPDIYLNVDNLIKEKSEFKLNDLNLLRLSKYLKGELGARNKGYNLIDIITILEGKFGDKYSSSKEKFDGITTYIDFKVFLEELTLEEITYIVGRLGLNIDDFLYKNGGFSGINYSVDDNTYDYNFAISKIAIYLNNQLVSEKGYYENNVSKMDFIDIIQEICPITFKDDKLKFISDFSKRDEEFYKMCLNKVKNGVTLRKILDTLKVPEVVRYGALKTFGSDKKIEELDVSKIALYLSGKFYGHYKEPFDKYELINIIKNVSLSIYEPDFLKITNSDDFYSMVLNSVKRRSARDYIKLIKKLNLPSDLFGLGENVIEDTEKEDNKFDARRFAMFLSGVMPYFGGKLSKYQFKKICKDNNFIDDDTLIEMDKNSKDTEDFFYIALCDMKMNGYIDNVFINRFKPYLDNINKEIPDEFIFSDKTINTTKDDKEIDVGFLALELSGKCQHNNYAKFSRLLFCEYLKDIYGYTYERIDFYWNQAEKYEETFYKMLLEKLQKESKKDILEKASFKKLLQNIKSVDGFLSDRDNTTEVVNEDYNFKTLSYYLAGSLRNHYRMPDTLEIVDYMNELDKDISMDKILKMFQISSGNVCKEEYFQSLLKYFFRKNRDKFLMLLEKLEVPKNIYFVDVHDVK